MKDGDVQCVYPQKQDAQQKPWVWEGQGGQIDRGGQPSQLCSVKHKQGQDVSDQSEQNNSGQQDSMQKKSYFHQVPYALGLGECQCKIFWSVPKNLHTKRYSIGYLIYLLTLMVEMLQFADVVYSIIYGGVIWYRISATQYNILHAKN